MAIFAPQPFSFTNGTVADATQVNADFNQIISNGNANAAANGANADITSLSALTTPLTVPQGGTGRTSFTATQVIVGNGTGGLLTTNVAIPFINFSFSLAGDVNLNNVSNYFDGPGVSQGSSGLWLAMGTVTVADTAGIAAFNCKLWDGTTVIDSARTVSFGALDYITVTLVGVISTPAGNIRISVQDPTANTGHIYANVSGAAKDSSITVMRIG